MKVYKKKSGWVFHWSPCCVAEEVGETGKIKGKNFLWLNWLFCFNG